MVADRLHNLFPELSAEQLHKLGLLENLYQDWNSRINVISRKDMDNFFIHHLLHSLSVAKIVQFPQKTKVLDIGTGGGFPGIPLAIMFPETQFTLVDSIGKKIKVVEAVCSELGISNVKALKARAEDIPGRYEFILSRAVAQLEKFYGWIKNSFANSVEGNPVFGLYALKGGDLQEEFSNFKDAFPKKEIVVHQLSEYFDDPFFETKKVVFVPIHQKIRSTK